MEPKGTGRNSREKLTSSRLRHWGDCQDGPLPRETVRWHWAPSSRRRRSQPPGGLQPAVMRACMLEWPTLASGLAVHAFECIDLLHDVSIDRKSTRLNSSHVS